MVWDLGSFNRLSKDSDIYEPTLSVSNLVSIYTLLTYMFILITVLFTTYLSIVQFSEIGSSVVIETYLSI